MNVVKLKNNAEEAEPLVHVIMLNLRQMIKDDPMALLDLIMKCWDGKYQFFGTAQKRLENAGLVINGTIHDSVKNIVLSSVEGNFPDIKLTNPIKE